MQKTSIPFSPSSSTDESLDFDFQPFSPEVINAYNEATKSGTQTPLIKEEIRTKILMKRVREGKLDEPETEAKRSKHDEPLTEEDLEKRRQRRERNKVAAMKCRQKKRDEAETLEEQTKVLQKNNTNLETEIENLNKEKEQLEDLLKLHQLWCDKTVFTIPTSKPVQKELRCDTRRTISESSGPLSAGSTDTGFYDDPPSISSTVAGIDGNVSAGTETDFSESSVDWNFLLDSFDSASADAKFKALSDGFLVDEDLGVVEEVVDSVIQL